MLTIKNTLIQSNITVLCNKNNNIKLVLSNVDLIYFLLNDSTINFIVNSIGTRKYARN